MEGAEPQPRTGPITVVIADDHPVVRRGLQALLDSIEGVSVVAEASDGAAAVREVQIASVDVALMDIQMPVMDGLEAARRIREVSPRTAVLVLTMYDDDATVFTAMQAGARGYLLKGAEQEEIERALHAVVAGEAIFGPGVATRMLNYFAQDPPAADLAFPELTDRERQILDRLAAGLPTSGIAQALHLSPKTVSNHLTSIFVKLQVASRGEAIVVARREGLGGP